MDLPRSESHVDEVFGSYIDAAGSSGEWGKWRTDGLESWIVFHSAVRVTSAKVMSTFS